jgi:hypothetical protein
MRIKKLSAALIVLLLWAGVSGCGRKTDEPDKVAVQETSETATSLTEKETVDAEETVTEESAAEPSEISAETYEIEEESEKMTMIIGDTEVPVTWEDSASVTELSALAKEGLKIPMSMYGGFEQVGSIGQSITRNDKQTTTSAGDIVLYSGNQLVVFYGSNSWAYTRLGRIDLSQDELTKLLSDGDVTITLKID